jgi:hypothetical protein
MFQMGTFHIHQFGRKNGIFKNQRNSERADVSFQFDR